MSVVERIAGFLGFISDRMLGLENRAHRLEQRTVDMAETLKSILDKLTAQGVSIDQLKAQRDAAEQADLDQVGAAIDANSAKFTAALAPSTGAAAPIADGTAQVGTTG